MLLGVWKIASTLIHYPAVVALFGKKEVLHLSKRRWKISHSIEGNLRMGENGKVTI